jgi:hypothetical protein
MGGIRMPSTSEVTIFVKAAPMMTPTARSTTLPRATNSLNSLTKPFFSAICGELLWTRLNERTACMTNRSARQAD